MARRRKKGKPETPAAEPTLQAANEQWLRQQYQEACQLGERGQYAQARQRYDQLAPLVTEPRLRALIHNDLAALDLVAGDRDAARRGFAEALALDSDCPCARDNLTLLEEDASQGEQARAEVPAPPSGDGQEAVRVAILSFLFNWPSSGGGIVHTAELVRFLVRAGYQVQHFYARHAPWGIGRVEGELPFPSQALEFDESCWHVAAIQERYRRAVDTFRPDYVFITDCWNFKPHLAEAMRGYPVYLRFQALEYLCPLNNVRLLVDGPDRFAQCPKHQLATPGDCQACLHQRGASSGGLHQAERALAGVGSPAYHEALCRALAEAEGVLVLNPFTEAMLSPYARRVHVVPWGMDPGRFPDPPVEPPARPVKVIFQAGVISEYMKGFHVLHKACSRLWRKRQDFELVATGEPAGPVDARTRFTGWVSQEELPRYYVEADVVAVPTVAQEGLSRTSVEAMSAARPVVASRIGGLPFTVADGATGLLCAPGDAADLASKIETLLDDAELRRRMGIAGRRRFEQDFTGAGVIDRHYRPLLQRRQADATARA
jgi:glycosyltransferase involved in cell wall biosynthesis